MLEWVISILEIFHLNRKPPAISNAKWTEIYMINKLNWDGQPKAVNNWGKLDV